MEKIWEITCGDNDEALKLTLRKFTSYKKPDFAIKEVESLNLRKVAFLRKATFYGQRMKISPEGLVICCIKLERIRKYSKINYTS